MIQRNDDGDTYTPDPLVRLGNGEHERRIHDDEARRIPGHVVGVLLLMGWGALTGATVALVAVRIYQGLGS